MRQQKEKLADIEWKYERTQNVLYALQRETAAWQQTPAYSEWKRSQPPSAGDDCMLVAGGQHELKNGRQQCVKCGKHVERKNTVFPC
jgi:hypothetical protein